ncbi:MAG TPA: potassium channel family protein, partial [Candidatus Binatia bacterium]|nr:potassium channel family protein [Candidatus Binatia bacterium]
PSLRIRFSSEKHMNLHGSAAAAIGGLIIIFSVLLDAFETIVLPRRVTRHFRLTAWFYRRAWLPWKKIASYVKTNSRRQNFLAYFGPLSLIMLLALWAATLILGFALLQFGAGEHEQLGKEPITFGRLLYHSGETFFTLGYGDIVPTSTAARVISVLEAGMGFAFLGVVIGYLPVVYGSFSRREIQISMLDARAGSPPTATELLVRLAGKADNPGIDQRVLDQVLRDWERWAGELLEAHLSYPVLSFFRSQHYNQSWLGALNVMLDVSSLVLTGIEGIQPNQAKLTFAMARHAAVDLAQVVNAQYDSHAPERLTDPGVTALRQTLAAAGLKLRNSEEALDKLTHLRSMYEPYLHAQAQRLMFDLPPWVHPEKMRDNWQAGPWDKVIQAKGLAVLGQRQAPPVAVTVDDHF